MAEIAVIKGRIASVTETKKVTDAMYMISSVKMNKARRAVEETKPFFTELKREMGELFLHIPETKNRYFMAPASGKDAVRGILLVTSDKGLAGAYNQSAIKVCETYLERHPEAKVFIVGEYGRQTFKAHGLPYEADFVYSAELPTVWRARMICADLLDAFDRGKVEEIHIIYTDYQNGGESQCNRQILLPIQRSRFVEPDAEKAQSRSLFVPDPDTVLSGIIPSYLTGFIYSSLVDSYCSEQQARMAAMSAASHNAEEMLRELKTRYNRIRQDMITREITEITAGARALRRAKAHHETKEKL